VLQFPLVQPLHPEPAELMRLLAAPLSPPLLNPKTDITRCTSAEPQASQQTASSLRNTSFSNLT
jgi:hypothetical protein